VFDEYSPISYRSYLYPQQVFEMKQSLVIGSNVSKGSRQNGSVPLVEGLALTRRFKRLMWELSLPRGIELFNKNIADC